jgi:hypothetical protein
MLPEEAGGAAWAVDTRKAGLSAVYHLLGGLLQVLEAVHNIKTVG